MKDRISTILIVVATMLVVATAALGEEAPERPRIGLCLAGGGARGGAHIGVLQVLEELRIPVDYVVGTSIGSIIGGLYASGMSPSEMDSTMLGIDWLFLLDDSPLRQFESFRRKQEDIVPYFGLEVGVGADGLKLPAGLIAGQKLMFLLRSLTLETIGIDDFDDLPIPYRAVASSLDDGSMVVLDHGTLADAMRASMAIPGAFTPYVIDGQTLVDGGILRNLPYDVIKSMGADIVIVVDVGEPLSDLAADPSLMGVLAQTVGVAIVANTNESLAQLTDEDVLLVPDLSEIGVGDFKEMAAASARGVEVARDLADQLSLLSVSKVEYEAWREGVEARKRTADILINAIRVESPSRVDPRRVHMSIDSEPSTLLDMDILAEDISRIYRTGEFEEVDFSLDPSDASPARDLVIRTRDKRWGPNYVRMGMAASGHVNGQAEYGLFLYHRMAEINRVGAEWRNQAVIGDRLGLLSDFYQPLSMSGRYFIVPRVFGLVDKRQQWLNFDQTDLVKSQQYQGALDIGRNLSHVGAVRLGVYYGHYDARTYAYADNVDQELVLNETMGGLNGTFVIDQLDNLNFPRYGWALNLDGRLSRAGLGATTAYDRLTASLRGATTNGRTTLSGRLEFGTSFESVLPYYDRFELGGFSRLSGLERGRISGDEMALLTMGVMVKIGELNPLLGRNIYLGLFGEAGQAWSREETPEFSDLVVGATTYLGVETAIGPIYIGYGMVEQGHDSFYLMLGRIF
jgi:NTE family protein